MEEHPVIEREHMRVHEENKTEASKVPSSGSSGLGQTVDDVGGPAGQCGSSWTKMGMDPDRPTPLPTHTLILHGRPQPMQMPNHIKNSKID